MISVGLNPFFIPFLGVLMVFKFHGIFSLYPSDFINSVLLLAFILTLLFPVISLFLLKKSNIISNINLHKRKERIVPTIITLCYYFAFYYFLRRIEGLDKAIFSGMFGGYFALTLALIITSYWKISLHTLGISTLTGLFLGITQVKFLDHSLIIILLFILIGIMGSSRLILKRHTPNQVYAGGLLGLIIPYIFVLNEWYI